MRRPTSRLVWSVGLVVAASTAFARPSRAQVLADEIRGPRFLLASSASSSRTVPLDVSRTPVLRRRIALDLDGVTLKEALATIGRQAGLELAYTEDVLPAQSRVHLRADEITVAAALTDALVDANVDVVFTPDGRAILKRRVGAAPLQTGSIVGRVTGAKTGTALTGATVVVDGTRSNATTGGDGRYRIAGLAPGTYTVRARYIGYAPGTLSVTVGPDQETTADLALEKSAQQLDEVVTTGTEVPTEVKAVPSPVSVITATEIEERQPKSITDVVREAVPSAVAWDISTTSPSQTIMSVRGSSTLNAGSGQLKVYLDGIEVASPSFAAIDPNSIERIEVIRGPQAATIYGSDAIGGVMQVFTKRADSTHIRPRIDASAAMGYVQGPYVGSSGSLRQEYKASVGGGSAAANYLFGFGYTHTGDWYPEAASSLPSAYSAVRVVQGALAVDLSARFYVQNNPSATFDPALAQSGFSYFSKPSYLADQSQSRTYGARLVYTPAPWWHHTLTVGADELSDDAHGTQPRLTDPSDTTLFVSGSSTTKASIAYRTAAAFRLSPTLSGDITAGADYYKSTALFFFANATTTSGVIPGASAIRDVVTNHGYFAQAQLAVWDKLFLTGGLRGDNSSTFGGDLGTPLTGRAGLSFAQPIGATTLKLRGSYGEALRPPSPDQSGGSISSFTVQLPNPNLAPERQKGWDAGADLVVGAHGALSVSYYNQTAQDLIEEVVLTPGVPQVTQIQNVGRVKNTGLELEGTLAFRAMQLHAQYAYTRSRVDDVGPNYTGDLRVGDQTFQVPKHTGGATLTVAPWRGMSVTTGITYVGSWTFYAYHNFYACIGGTGPCQPSFRNYLIQYPSFVKAHVRVSQQITPMISGFVSVDNVTNNEAFEYGDITPRLGRVTMVGLRARY